MANRQTDNQSEPKSVIINEVLLGIIRNRAQHSIEDEDSESSVEPVRNKKRAVDQEATAESFRLRNRKAKVNLSSRLRLF